MTFLPVVSSPLPSSHVVYPVFFLNSAKKIILFGCHPLDGVTRAGPPPPSASDATDDIEKIGCGLISTHCWIFVRCSHSDFDDGDDDDDDDEIDRDGNDGGSDGATVLSCCIVLYKYTQMLSFVFNR